MPEFDTPVSTCSFEIVDNSKRNLYFSCQALLHPDIFAAEQNFCLEI